jgi:hypothetical protein
MTKLIAVGDSFTWGSDLSDSNGRKYSMSTYSALAAKHMNYEYVCAAAPGCSNSTIARRCIHYCETIKDNLFVMVMWTYPYRTETYPKQQNQNIEKYDNFLTVSGWHGMNFDEKVQHWGKMSEGQRVHFKREHDAYEKIGIAELSRNLVNHAHDNWFLYETLRCMTMTKLYLESKNIPYIFLTACDAAIPNIMNSSEEYITTFKNIALSANWANAPSILDWARLNNYEVGFGSHPLEPAHEAYFNEFIKTTMTCGA